MPSYTKLYVYYIHSVLSTYYTHSIVYNNISYPRIIIYSIHIPVTFRAIVCLWGDCVYDDDHSLSLYCVCVVCSVVFVHIPAGYISREYHSESSLGHTQYCMYTQSSNHANSTLPYLHLPHDDALYVIRCCCVRRFVFSYPLGEIQQLGHARVEQLCFLYC